MKNPVKEKLARGELVASMIVRLVCGVEIVRIAKSAGFDSLYIDLEHSSLTLHAASQISIAGLDAEIPVFVRVPANTPEYISRVLDGGALGVIAPGVQSAQEARAVVAAALDGIDMVLIGSNDLLADLGLAGQYDHPSLAQAYERAIAACRRGGRHVGIGGLGTRPDLVEKFVKLGARYVSTGNDLAFLLAECTRRARQVKDLRP
jgi:4-hydroxy-2-oxoheptanedioate aldolase